MQVHVNAAVSIDGKLSSRRREQLQISGPEDFARVEDLRREHDGILVGVGTVLADDPQLNTGEAPPGAAVHPTRVVVDSRGETPPGARVLDETAPTVILASDQLSEDRREAYEAAGATVCQAGVDRVDLTAGFEALDTRGLDSILVEGGGEIIFSCIEAELVDVLSVYVGNTVIGGRDAPTLADGAGFVEQFPAFHLDDVTRLDTGVVLTWRPQE